MPSSFCKVTHSVYRRIWAKFLEQTLYHLKTNMGNCWHLFGLFAWSAQCPLTPNRFFGSFSSHDDFSWNILLFFRQFQFQFLFQFQIQFQFKIQGVNWKRSKKCSIFVQRNSFTYLKLSFLEWSIAVPTIKYLNSKCSFFMLHGSVNQIQANLIKTAAFYLTF